MVTTFYYLKESIPAKDIKNLSALLSEDQLKTFVAFMICKELSGCPLFIPLKAHNKEFAKLLLDLQLPQTKIKEVLKNEMNLDNRTIKKIFKEYEDERNS